MSGKDNSASYAVMNDAMLEVWNIEPETGVPFAPLMAIFCKDWEWLYFLPHLENNCYLFFPLLQSQG